jgi:hypothetical protein
LFSAISTRAEYWYDEGGDTGGGNSVGVVGDASGRLKLRRDPPACADLGATGEVVSGGAGADDEVADDCELSFKHADGATIQSMNCQAAAMRVTSSRTVVMPWAKKWRYPDGSCREPSVPATALNMAFPIETALLST